MPRNIPLFARFGKLTVAAVAWEPSTHCKYVCVCDCGKMKTVRGSHLICGNTKSCGCWRKHGQSKARTTEYKAWQNMNDRCSNRNDPHWKWYGGRGIWVCGRWSSKDPYGFKNFFEDMGKKPDPKFSIHRIDNDGNYEPSNCKWASSSEQASNRRKPKRRAA